MQTIRPEWQVPAHVHVHSTTRLGGVSEKPYDSLNLGLHVHDKPAHVQENRKQLALNLALPSAPIWMNQVHGVDVFHRTAQSANSTEVICADAAFTQEKNAVVAVLTADCLPVVLSNQSGTAVAVVHAGWRGLAAGILHKAQALFSSDELLFAWLAPAIGPEKFEVGVDVYDAFTARISDNKHAFTELGGGKYRANLYELAQNELQAYRPTSVSGGNYCTHSQSSLFHSYRRDGVHSGRMATLAWISP